MTNNPCCPLCAQDRTATLDILICEDCHNNLRNTGALPIAITGEFTAITEHSVSTSAKTVPSAGARSKGPTRCCWCDKGPEQVRKLLSQNGYHICNQCVSLCADILQMELGHHYGD